TPRNWARVGRLTAMAWSPLVTARFEAGLGGDTGKLSDKARIMQIARPHLAGDRAFLDHENPLRQRRDEIEILLHQNHRETAVVAQPLQGVDDLVDDRGLDALCRLVE